MHYEDRVIQHGAGRVFAISFFGRADHINAFNRNVLVAFTVAISPLAEASFRRTRKD
jgi:hypothetical protein